MADRGMRSVEAKKIGQVAPGAEHRVGTADANLAKARAASARGIELGGQPAVEARRETGPQARHEMPLCGACRDDPLDPPVEVTGAEMKEGYHQRAGT